MYSPVPSNPKFSLIIPTYNEEAYLPSGLKAVEMARKTYEGGAPKIEVIVADNGSTDATESIAVEYGAKVVREEKRIIAAVRNTGARRARGEILIFLDADTLIHPETFNAMERCLSSGKYVAGATGVKLERFSVGIAAAYAALVPMVWVTGMDTGAVFCRHDDFRDIGGYDETKLFAEDVDFLWRLKRLGHKRGQKLVRLRSAKAIVSTRKFDEHGDWHFLKMIAWFLCSQLFSPHKMDKFAATYWYGEQRTRRK